LPLKDCNLFFEDHGPEEFEQLLRAARSHKAITGESRRQSMYQAEERGFRVGYGRRQYQIKGIQQGPTQLKATIKASSDLNNSSKAFELTTIDLYSSRSRAWFAGLCSSLFNEPEGLIKQDIVKLMTLVEEYREPAKIEDEEKVIITPQDRKLALGFLENPEIFQEILDDFVTMGVSGEETNKLVGYLAATSRKLADPLSIMIQSRSAAGKSTMQDAILNLIPEEEYEKYTRMSDQALFYKGEESLMNKVLAIEEAEGMGGAAYAIRNIQSAKQISLAVTGKDPARGKMETQEYTVKGPVCVMITTTATDIDQETASRFIFLTIDESMAMTEAIHRVQREAETLEGLIRDRKQDRIITKHHTAQRILHPLSVVNPFARYLTYPA
ncbi:MAG: DNA primase, partial [Deltaproteobacteria bacterium]|nr:DNA primase [Deltaproteobacteria bacterium]